MSEAGVAFTGQGMLWRFLRPARGPRRRRDFSLRVRNLELLQQAGHTALFSNAVQMVKATALSLFDGPEKRPKWVVSRECESGPPLL